MSASEGTEISVTTEDAIYLKGDLGSVAPGSDEFDGTTRETPVATFEKALELAKNTESKKIVVLNGALLKSGTEENPVNLTIEGVTIQRDSEETEGELLHVSGLDQKYTTVTFKDVILDGNNIPLKTRYESPLLFIAGGATVNIESGTKLINNRYGAIVLRDSSDGDATLNMSGGEISDNISPSSSYAAGVTISGGKFVMSGGFVKNNNATGAEDDDYGEGGGVVIRDDAEFEMTGGSIEGNTAASCGGGLVCIGIAELKGGTIRDNTATWGAGVMLYDGYEEDGLTPKLVLSGTTITGNTANGDCGGGVFCSDAEFIITEGSVTQNTATYAGGGIYCRRTAMEMTGGLISENICTSDGAGGLFICTLSKFNMKGGTIEKNTALYNGGGILCRGAELDVSGGSISENISTAGKGNAIAIGDNGDGVAQLKLSGQPDILGDIYLYQSKKVDVTGDITSAEPFEINMPQPKAMDVIASYENGLTPDLSDFVLTDTRFETVLSGRDIILKNGVEFNIIPESSLGNVVYGDSVKFTFSLNSKIENDENQPGGNILVAVDNKGNYITLGNLAENPDLAYEISDLSAGSHTIYVKYEGDANFAPVEKEISFTVKQKELSITWKNTENRTPYDGRVVTAEFAGALPEDDVSLVVTGGDASEAGTYVATAVLAGKDCGNYKLPSNASVQYTIERPYVPPTPTPEPTPTPDPIPENFPEGSVENPDGSITTPNGTEVDKDGTITLPDGTELKPDSDGKAPTIDKDNNVTDTNGTVIDKDGNITLPGKDTESTGDDTKIETGTGTESPKYDPEKENVTTKDGNTVTLPGGKEITPPAGSVVEKDGTITQPDGTVITPDGTTTKPDGTVISPDGTIYNTDGSIQAADKTYLRPATAMLKRAEVSVSVNQVKAILSGECAGAEGYDYVISKNINCIKDKDYLAVNKNNLLTTAYFRYIPKGTYYVYCHAWIRGEDGKKVFGKWSNYKTVEVTAVTPKTPKIVDVKASGRNVTVTYTRSKDATGYDVVLGKAARKVYGEYRPVNYDKNVKKVYKKDTVTVTFKNVKPGTYYAGLHAYNRTSEDNKKVFSSWSNVRKIKVK